MIAPILPPILPPAAKPLPASVILTPPRLLNAPNIVDASFEVEETQEERDTAEFTKYWHSTVRLRSEDRESAYHAWMAAADIIRRYNPAEASYGPELRVEELTPWPPLSPSVPESARATVWECLQRHSRHAFISDPDAPYFCRICQVTKAYHP